MTFIRRKLVSNLRVPVARIFFGQALETGNVTDAITCHSTQGMQGALVVVPGNGWKWLVYSVYCKHQHKEGSEISLGGCFEDEIPKV